MNSYVNKRKSSICYRIISGFIAFAFLFTMILPPQVAAQIAPTNILNLPAPGAMVTMSAGFNPALIKGITIHPDNPLLFDFIVHNGDDDLQDQQLREEAHKMIKYFLASLTTPQDEMWVNLSPYEKDRMISNSFGETEMGRDLLAQDYILKQLTASLIYPEDDLGDEFWYRVRAKAQEMYGTTDIPMNTFNKIWIVPNEAVVYEKETSAFVVESNLKVMLEEDYLALDQHLNGNSPVDASGVPTEAKAVSGISSEIVREILIPEIEKEVNEGENFANLRQIYHAMILAAWYKENLKESLLGLVYVNQGKTKGIDLNDDAQNKQIYNQYLEAFEKGVYNYIREDYDAEKDETIPRKYFSGGFGGQLQITSSPVMGPGQADRMIYDFEDSTKSRIFQAGLLEATSEVVVNEFGVQAGVLANAQEFFGENVADSANDTPFAMASSPVMAERMRKTIEARLEIVKDVKKKLQEVEEKQRKADALVEEYFKQESFEFTSVQNVLESAEIILQIGSKYRNQLDYLKGVEKRLRLIQDAYSIALTSVHSGKTVVLDTLGASSPIAVDELDMSYSDTIHEALGTIQAFLHESFSYYNNSDNDAVRETLIDAREIVQLLIDIVASKDSFGEIHQALSSLESVLRNAEEFPSDFGTFYREINSRIKTLDELNAKAKGVSSSPIDGFIDQQTNFRPSKTDEFITTSGEKIYISQRAAQIEQAIQSVINVIKNEVEVAHFPAKWLPKLDGLPSVLKEMIEKRVKGVTVEVELGELSGTNRSADVSKQLMIVKMRNDSQSESLVVAEYLVYFLNEKGNQSLISPFAEQLIIDNTNLEQVVSSSPIVDEVIEIVRANVPNQSQDEAESQIPLAAIESFDGTTPVKFTLKGERGEKGSEVSYDYDVTLEKTPENGVRLIFEGDMTINGMTFPKSRGEAIEGEIGASVVSSSPINYYQQKMLQRLKDHPESNPIRESKLFKGAFIDQAPWTDAEAIMDLSGKGYLQKQYSKNRTMYFITDSGKKALKVAEIIRDLNERLRQGYHIPMSKIAKGGVEVAQNFFGETFLVYFNEEDQGDIENTVVTAQRMRLAAWGLNKVSNKPGLYFINEAKETEDYYVDEYPNMTLQLASRLIESVNVTSSPINNPDNLQDLSLMERTLKGFNQIPLEEYETILDKISLDPTQKKKRVVEFKLLRGDNEEKQADSLPEFVSFSNEQYQIMLTELDQYAQRIAGGLGDVQKAAGQILKTLPNDNVAEVFARYNSYYIYLDLLKANNNGATGQEMVDILSEKRPEILKDLADIASSPVENWVSYVSPSGNNHEFFRAEDEVINYGYGSFEVGVTYETVTDSKGSELYKKKYKDPEGTLFRLVLQFAERKDYEGLASLLQEKEIIEKEPLYKTSTGDAASSSINSVFYDLLVGYLNDSEFKQSLFDPDRTPLSEKEMIVLAHKLELNGKKYKTFFEIGQLDEMLIEREGRISERQVRKIYFDAVRKAVRFYLSQKDTPAPDIASSPIDIGSKRVLVIDKEPRVSDDVRRSLVSAGFAYDNIITKRILMDISEDEAGNFDLVIADIDIFHGDIKRYFELEKESSKKFFIAEHLMKLAQKAPIIFLIDENMLENDQAHIDQLTDSDHGTFVELYLKEARRGLQLGKRAKNVLEETVSSPVEQSDPTKKVGGIDLNPDHMDLQIKRDGNGVPLPVWNQPIESMNIEGFVPVIINVLPVNVPLMLGLVDTDGNPTPLADANNYDDLDSARNEYLDKMKLVG